MGEKNKKWKIKCIFFITPLDDNILLFKQAWIFNFNKLYIFFYLCWYIFVNYWEAKYKYKYKYKLIKVQNKLHPILFLDLKFRTTWIKNYNIYIYIILKEEKKKQSMSLSLKTLIVWTSQTYFPIRLATATTMCVRFHNSNNNMVCFAYVPLKNF